MNNSKGFLVVRGNQLEDMTSLLCEVSKRKPLGIFESEQYLVQSNGIAQWLKESIAKTESDGGLGVCMGVDMAFPGQFIWKLYRAAFPELPELSAYERQPILWRVFKILGDLDRYDDKGLLAPLKKFLEQDGKSNTLRFSLADQIAKLYDQYQIYRADWLIDWEDNNDILRNSNTLIGASDQNIEADQLWQPELWRIIVDDIKSADDSLSLGTYHAKSRSSVHSEFLDYCSNNNDLAGIPKRINVFGISSLPFQTVEALMAVSKFCEVILYCLDPSEHYWFDLIDKKQVLKHNRIRINEESEKAADLDSMHIDGNALLASWGQQGRDYLQTLIDLESAFSKNPAYVKLQYALENQGQIELYTQKTGTTLLNQVQSGIYNLQSATDIAATNPVISGADQSITFTKCHSRLREVEVLHDQILDKLEYYKQQGKEINLRDMIVMAPDINQYAPYIEAVFGQYKSIGGSGQKADSRYIPFHITDQVSRHKKPLIIAMEKLLNVTRSRFEATEILELLDIKAIQSKFNLEVSDIPQIKEWVSESHIRWGLNLDQKIDVSGINQTEQNSWEYGAERLMAGLTTGDSINDSGMCGVSSVNELNADIMGEVYKFIETISEIWTDTQKHRSIHDWSDFIADMIEKIFLIEDIEDVLMINKINDAITSITDAAVQAGNTHEEFEVTIMREVLLEAIDRPDLNQSFLSGRLNFASLMPMRTVPFDNVWMLGLNDGEFPSVDKPNDLDLMATSYRAGDRSRREDSRYIFLETLLSARESFNVIWIGRSTKDNTELAPSILVNQLIDFIQTAFGFEFGPEQLFTEHPMHPYNRDYFFGDSKLSTYANQWAAVHTEVSEYDVHNANLAPHAFKGELSHRMLRDFLRNPTDAFYSQRLKVTTPHESEAVLTNESFSLSPLDKWGIRDHLFKMLVAQPDTDADLVLENEVNLMVTKGEVPVGATAEIMTDQLFMSIKHASSEFHKLKSNLVEDENLPIQISTQVPSKLNNAVLPLLDDLPALLIDKVTNEPVQLLAITSDITESNGYPRWNNLMEPWVKHLTGTVACNRSITTVMISPSGQLEFAPINPPAANELLTNLIQLWHESMSKPVPIACNSALEFFYSRPHSKKSPDDRAAFAYKTKDAEYSQHMGRLFPDYSESLATHLMVIETFRTCLYEPIAQHLQTAQE